MRFAVISDLHVRIDGLLYGLDTQKRLDDVLSDIDREAPDLVVVTGDLADCADLGSYRLIKERLESLSRPVYVLPGNHDDPVQMRQIFPAAPAVSVFSPGGYFTDAVETDEAILVFLTTTIPNTAAGRVSPEALQQIRHMRRKAISSQRALLVFLHHPPFRSGYIGMDACALENRREFLAAFGNVSPTGKTPSQKGSEVMAGIFCGHLHRPMASLVEGLPCWTVPSVAHSLAAFERSGAVRAAAAPPGWLRGTLTKDSLVCEFVEISAQPVFPIPFIPLRARVEEQALKVLSPANDHMSLRKD